MGPIRVGLVGLSTSSNPSAPGAWGVLAHLPSLQASPHYEIVALANSTVKSAQASIAHHRLGSNVKAYGAPEDLAEDPNVELIAISVNVEKHYALAKPALLAKKDVLMEWPLGVSTVEAAELTELARSQGVKTVVGLQARANPLVLKVKQLLDSDRIGKVMSSTVVATFGGIPVDAWAQSAEYYLDIKSGGNVLTIYFGHRQYPCLWPFNVFTRGLLTRSSAILVFDTFIQVLGDFAQLHSVLKTQYPTIKLLDDAGDVVDNKHPKSAPDHILVHGTLSSGAVVSLNYRSVNSAIDGKGVRWLITGTKGEIEITTPEMPWQMGPPGTTLKIRSGKDGDVEDFDFRTTGAASPMGFPAANTAAMYDAFAKGEVEKYATFESALATHRLLDVVISNS